MNKNKSVFNHYELTLGGDDNVIIKHYLLNNVMLTKKLIDTTVNAQCLKENIT